MFAPADLKEEPTKRNETELILRDSRLVGYDEDGGYRANIAASGAIKLEPGHGVS